MPIDELMPRERVIEALALREPDRVPWIELEVEQIVFDKILEKMIWNLYWRSWTAIRNGYPA
jgi:hypothetical protein